MNHRNGFGRLAGLALLLPLMLFAVGCETQRPVESIRSEADFHYQQERYARAAEGYAAIAARYPGDWRAQHRLGLSLLEVGELPGARRALELAHTLRPGDDGIIDALAEAMFQQGDHEYLFTFLKHRAEERQTASAYQRLARYAREMGDPDSAQTAIRTAIRLDGGQSIGPYVEAADLAEQLGHVDEAVRRLRQALYINPRHEVVKARLRDLGEVPGPTLALPPDV